MPRNNDDFRVAQKLEKDIPKRHIRYWARETLKKNGMMREIRGDDMLLAQKTHVPAHDDHSICVLAFWGLDMLRHRGGPLLKRILALARLQPQAVKFQTAS